MAPAAWLLMGLSCDRQSRLPVRRSGRFCDTRMLSPQGLGLYAARDIEKHTMVIEYIGTIIRNEVANRKEKLYESQVRAAAAERVQVRTNAVSGDCAASFSREPSLPSQCCGRRGVWGVSLAWPTAGWLVDRGWWCVCVPVHAPSEAPVSVAGSVPVCLRRGGALSGLSFRTGACTCSAWTTTT